MSEVEDNIYKKKNINKQICITIITIVTQHMILKTIALITAYIVIPTHQIVGLISSMKMYCSLSIYGANPSPFTLHSTLASKAEIGVETL